jgi:hypothetical protein
VFRLKNSRLMRKSGVICLSPDAVHNIVVENTGDKDRGEDTSETGR